MIKAVWRGRVIAEAESTEVLEGNHYFFPEALHKEYLEPSETHSTCPWKGNAHYYSIVVDGETNPAAAWFYPDPKPAAKRIAGKIAFWKGVRIET